MNSSEYSKPFCPCDCTELIPTDRMDSWNEDDYTKGALWIGECPKCRRQYKWNVIYKATYFTDLQEDLT